MFDDGVVAARCAARTWWAMGGATGRPPEEQLSRRWPALLGTGAVAAMHSEVVVKKPESLPYGGEWSGLDARRR